MTECHLDGRNCPVCGTYGDHGDHGTPANDDRTLESGRQIEAVCDQIKGILVAKNHAYGNSALAPVRVLSKADPVEQLLVRADDKLSRIQHGDTYGNEDHFLDLAGYLILLVVARRYGWDGASE